MGISVARRPMRSVRVRCISTNANLQASYKGRKPISPSAYGPWRFDSVALPPQLPVSQASTPWAAFNSFSFKARSAAATACICSSMTVVVLAHRHAGIFFLKSSSISAAARLTNHQFKCAGNGLFGSHPLVSGR